MQAASDHPTVHRANYLNYILDQLSDLDDLTFKKRIGGVSFFRKGIRFAAIIGGKFRFKVPENHGKKPGTDCEAHLYYNLDNEVYCTVPEEVIEDKVLLKKWAETACEEALKHS